MRSVTLLLTLYCWLQCFSAQAVPAKKPETQRAFSQSPAVVEAAVKKLAGGTSGRLPVLDGFVIPGERTLERYERPYYQCQVRVTSAPSSGSVAHVTAKITAWYDGNGGNAGHADPQRLGYQVLESNGRIETDLLDRLQEILEQGSQATVHSSSRQTTAQAGAESGIPVGKSAPAPDLSAPMPQLPRKPALDLPVPGAPPSPANPALEKEAKNLEEILRNQSHPTNLIAVKNDQTPVSESPSASAKVLFLASAQDEFEVLDVNPEWIHVRISGLSRGWLRRSTVEILGDSAVESGPVKPPSEPEATAPNQAPPNTAAANPAAPNPGTPDPGTKPSSLFSVSSDEVGSFPGDWAPLKGKSVKIISVQQAPGSGRITSPQDKMQFAESLFREDAVSSPAQGLVLIFDAEDGGMIAATVSALKQWKTGALSAQAFWKQCFLDPPELLGAPD